jgi:hypothetical protein
MLEGSHLREQAATTLRWIAQLVASQDTFEARGIKAGFPLFTVWPVYSKYIQSLLAPFLRAVHLTFWRL